MASVGFPQVTVQPYPASVRGYRMPFDERGRRAVHARSGTEGPIESIVTAGPIRGRVTGCQAGMTDLSGPQVPW